VEASRPLVNGYIEFTVPGGNETRSRMGSATKDARRNENAVIVTRQQVPAFVVLRCAVEEAMAGGPPAQTDGRTPPPPPPASRTHRECCLGTGGKRCRPQGYGTSSCTRRDIPAPP
jgi:hypothetical protein